MRWHNAAVLCALLAHGGAAMAQQVAAPGNPSAPAGAVAVDPNAIRVLLSPELETTLVSPFAEPTATDPETRLELLRRARRAGVAHLPHHLVEAIEP